MADINLRAQPLNVYGTTGDDISIVLTVQDSAGDPIDVSGYTISAKVWRGATEVDEMTDAVSGASNNVITLSFTDTETTAIGTERGLRWSLSMTTGGITEQWVGGKFELLNAGHPKASGVSAATLTYTSGDVTVTLGSISTTALDGRYAPRPASDGTAGQALKITSLSPLVTEWGDAGGASSDSPTFTGDVDASGADSVLVPDGTADGHAVAVSAYDAATGQFDIQGNQIGDTGWRNVNTDVLNAWAFPGPEYGFRIRRIGNTVHFVMRASSASATSGQFYAIPTGFKAPSGTNVLNRIVLTGASVVSSVWRNTVVVYASDSLYCIADGQASNPPSASDNRVTGCWVTDEAWPATLPGTAA